MGHVPRWMGGDIPDQLHHGNRQSSIIERGCPGRTTQHGILLGHGLPPLSREFHTIALPREAHTLTHQASGDPRQDILHVRRAPGVHSQATSEGTLPPGMDLSVDMEYHQHQDCGAPAEVPTELPGTQLHNKDRRTRGQAQTGSQSGVCGGVPPCIQYTSY